MAIESTAVACYSINVRKTKKTKCINGYSCWQILLHEDLLEAILQHLSFKDRIRLSAVCISWRSVVMRKEIHGAPHELPWLHLPQYPSQTDQSREFLSFYSLHDRTINKLMLPKPLQGGWVSGSSKDWLFVMKELGPVAEIFLLNPISRVHCQLPSQRTTIEVDGERQANHTVDFYQEHFALSTSDVSSEYCMVALAYSTGCFLCRPGDDTWIIFDDLFDTKENHTVVDILFSSGTLYVLVDVGGTHEDGTVEVEARTISFRDHEVEVKLVYDYYSNDFDGLRNSQLLELSISEVLLVRHVCVDDNNGGWKTSDFEVYKHEMKNDKFLRSQVTTLGDQILFLGDAGSMSFPVNEMKELELKGKDYIFFATNTREHRAIDASKVNISGEMGIYYLADGTIHEQSLPIARLSQFEIFMDPETSNWKELRKLTWFTPSL